MVNKIFAVWLTWNLRCDLACPLSLLLRRQAGCCTWAKTSGPMSTALCGQLRCLRRTTALFCTSTVLWRGDDSWSVTVTCSFGLVSRAVRFQPVGFPLTPPVVCVWFPFSDVSAVIRQVPPWAAASHLVRATTTSCALAPVTVCSRMTRKSTATNTETSSVARYTPGSF